MVFESKNKKKRGGGVVRVSDLFAKYATSLQAPQKTVIKAFTAALFDELGVRIDDEDCTYRVENKTLMVRAPGMIKTEIKLRKQKILLAMQKAIGAKNVPKEIL